MNQGYRERDEIELAQIVAMVADIVRRHWLIVCAVVILCGAVAAAVSLVLTPIYKVTAIIEPGILGREENGQLMRSDSASNLANQIGNGSMDGEVLARLGLDPRPFGNTPIFATRVLGDPERTPKTEFRSIEISCKHDDPEMGRRLVRTVIDVVLEKKRGYIDTMLASMDANIAQTSASIAALYAEQANTSRTIASKENLIRTLEKQKKDAEAEAAIKEQAAKRAEGQIEQASHDIGIKKDEISATREQNRNLEAANKLIQARIAQLEKDLAAVRENAALIAKSRVESAPGAAQDANRALGFLLFGAVAQENISYAEKLAGDIHALKTQLQDNQTSIALNRIAIKTIEREIEKTAIKRDRILRADADEALLEKHKQDLLRDEELPSKINDVKIEQEILRSKRDVEIPLQIVGLQQDIVKKQLGKEQVFALRVVQEPRASVKPVAPKKRLIVIAAMAVAFLGCVALIAIREIVGRSMASLGAGRA